jgi:hypothetical protein
MEMELCSFKNIIDLGWCQDKKAAISKKWLQMWDTDENSVSSVDVLKADRIDNILGKEWSWGWGEW